MNDKGENMDTDTEVMMLKQKVDSYHAEKNKCMSTCEKFGIRIGGLEIKEAVQDNQITTMEQLMEKMVNKMDSLQIKVATMIGVGMAVNVLISKFWPK